jgi:ferritin-like metal-binding protein YciE
MRPRQKSTSRLEQVLEKLDEVPRGRTCNAIMGIIEERQEIMKELKGAPESVPKATDRAH